MSALQIKNTFNTKLQRIIENWSFSTKLHVHLYWLLVPGLWFDLSHEFFETFHTYFPSTLGNRTLEIPTITWISLLSPA